MTVRILTLVLFLSLCLTHYALSISNAIPEEQEQLPPLELYVIDVPLLPKATGIKGSTYSASLYIVNNITKSVVGPYRGSSFPNSKEIPEGSDKPNTVTIGNHIFNNKYGHKGGTVKGLNLVNSEGDRIVDGYSWSKKPSKVKYANVHSGFSDKGNFNSRGSMGCITIHPSDVNEFWQHFDFSKGTKGNATGMIYIYRDTLGNRQKLIQEITSLY